MASEPKKVRLVRVYQWTQWTWMAEARVIIADPRNNGHKLRAIGGDKYEALWNLSEHLGAMGREVE